MDEWITPFLNPNSNLKQEGVYPAPRTVDRTIYIDFFMKVIPPVLRFEINGHIYHHPEVPYINQVRDGINITDNQQVFEIIEGESVRRRLHFLINV